MNRSQGFSLVELMIALVLGLVISGAIIQTMVGSRVTNSLNQAVSQVQEAGRFITTRLNRELIEAGRYDMVSGQIDNSVDTVVEAAYIENHPIVLQGDYAGYPTLGASQGAAGADDAIAVNMLALQDCTGNRHGYAPGDEFHVVNMYQISGGRLTCTGYDGRVLRGLKVAGTTPTAVTLLDNVENFQVQYGVTAQADSSNGQAVIYVTGSELDALRADNRQVVAVRFAVLLKSDKNQVVQANGQQFALLNENARTYDTKHYFQVFTQSVALRNMKNFVRSSQ